MTNKNKKEAICLDFDRMQQLAEVFDHLQHVVTHVIKPNEGVAASMTAMLKAADSFIKKAVEKHEECHKLTPKETLMLKGGLEFAVSAFNVESPDQQLVKDIYTLSQAIPAIAKEVFAEVYKKNKGLKEVLKPLLQAQAKAGTAVDEASAEKVNQREVEIS